MQVTCGHQLRLGAVVALCLLLASCAGQQQTPAADPNVVTTDTAPNPNDATGASEPGESKSDSKDGTPGQRGLLEKTGELARDAAESGKEAVEKARTLLQQYSLEVGVATSSVTLDISGKFKLRNGETDNRVSETFAAATPPYLTLGLTSPSTFFGDTRIGYDFRAAYSSKTLNRQLIYLGGIDSKTTGDLKSSVELQYLLGGGTVFVLAGPKAGNHFAKFGLGAGAGLIRLSGRVFVKDFTGKSNGKVFVLGKYADVEYNEFQPAFVRILSFDYRFRNLFVQLSRVEGTVADGRHQYGVVEGNGQIGYSFNF